MYENRDISIKQYNEEAHRIVGELQLHEYGTFLEKYNYNISVFKKRLTNKHNVWRTPISIKNDVAENISILQLVQSDNKLLSRTLASLASICNEIDLLTNEAKEYQKIFVFYGEESRKDVDSLHQISSVVDSLQRTNFFLTRTHQVIILLVRQLCAILDQSLYIGNTVSCFPEPLDSLSEILSSLVIFDNLLSGSLLKSHWNLYHRAVRSMLHNPAKFDISLDQLRSLDKCFIEIEKKLFSGTIFQQAIDKCVDDNLVLVVKQCNLSNEFFLVIQQLLTELERNDEDATYNCVKVNVLFVVQHHLCGGMDKKISKRLTDINKKICACVISENIVWYPDQFLSRHIPFIAKSLDLKSLANNRAFQLANRTQNLSKDSHQFYVQVCTWMIDIKRMMEQDKNHFKLKHLQDACNLYAEGIKIVNRINRLVKWITNLHAAEGKPMLKSVLLLLCKLTEALKAMHFIANRNLLPLTYVVLLISQYLKHKVLVMLQNIKKSFTQEKTYKNRQLDILSALTVAERSLKGCDTKQRALVAKLALSASGLDQENLIELRTVINRLESINSFQAQLNKFSNCSFLYSHRVILPIHFAHLVESRVDLSRIYLLLDAMNDCKAITDDEMFRMICASLKNDLLNPLNQSIETNLRLQTHLHLDLPHLDPFSNVPLLSFKNYSPAHFNKYYVNVKQEVECYLSTMFYNLTTVVLYDWRTYGEMRRLASLQYGLSTVEDCLPMQTLEQGPDVLEIMRNINVFVGKYLYNLNNQIFVEESSNNKHLNTINISHVANSIRTHGIGIMNTTVNFTYQFLQNKFYIFSQFLFDEHIKSRLLKDLRHFVEHKNDSNQMYPYERAEKFILDIKRLGSNFNGLSYLDLFRKLITQIGNAMGYVRMVRAGGRRCLADATCFIPDLREIDKLSEVAKTEIPSSTTAKASECFANDIKTLCTNFEEATEYFKLLVKVFIPIFRNSQNLHLKNFYIIVPPLTINFIEHSLTCKERLNKKNRTGAAFTDDGFAMGLAYIVHLLNQGGQLNSLHWFQSVKCKLAHDKKNLEQQKILASKEDDKLQQTLALTEKRLNAIDREFILLYYNFNSARIFFQS